MSLWGLGILEELLADPQVTEIMVNGCDRIYCEKGGKVCLSEQTITSNIQLRNIIERIVTPLGRRIDEKTPYVDARLADGSRVNAIIEPLSLDGPRPYDSKISGGAHHHGRLCLSFSLHHQRNGGLFKDLCGAGAECDYLRRHRIGKDHSFKCAFRIYSIRGGALLQWRTPPSCSSSKSMWCVWRPAPPNMEGTGEVTIRDLIRNTLRMRPDRIVVGECRDGAALDMLSAMNTGHDGSLTTVHANNPREAVARLETLCLMAGMELPAKSIREQIASAVNLVVQIGRMSDGSRKIKNITEVVGMQGDVITLQEVFRFKEESFDKRGKIIGQFQASGIIPSFIEKFEQRGVHIPRALFTTQSSEDMKKSSFAARGVMQKRPVVLQGGPVRAAAAPRAAAPRASAPQTPGAAGAKPGLGKPGLGPKAPPFSSKAGLSVRSESPPRVIRSGARPAPAAPRASAPRASAPQIRRIVKKTAP